MQRLWHADFVLAILMRADLRQTATKTRSRLGNWPSWCQTPKRPSFWHTLNKCKPRFANTIALADKPTPSITAPFSFLKSVKAQRGWSSHRTSRTADHYHSPSHQTSHISRLKPTSQPFTLPGRSQHTFSSHKRISPPSQ